MIHHELRRKISPRINQNGYYINTEKTATHVVTFHLKGCISVRNAGRLTTGIIQCILDEKYWPPSPNNNPLLGVLLTLGLRRP